MRALFRYAIVWAGLLLLVQGASASELPAVPVGTQQPATAQDDDFDCVSRITASPFIPVDSWVYPAMLRLYGLGYGDAVYLGMRPWTRASLSNMLEDVADRLEDADSGPLTDEAQKLYDALSREAGSDVAAPCATGK